MVVILIIAFAVLMGVVLYFSFEKPIDEPATLYVTEELNRKMDICDFAFCKYNCNYKCFKPLHPEANEVCKYVFCNSMIMDMAERTMKD